MNVAEIVSYLSGKTAGARIPGNDVSFQFHLTGTGGGDFYVKIAGGTPEVQEGQVLNPNLTVTMTSDDMTALLQRKADAMNLYFQGRIRVDGDLSLALRLTDVLR